MKTSEKIIIALSIAYSLGLSFVIKYFLGAISNAPVAIAVLAGVLVLLLAAFWAWIALYNVTELCGDEE